MLCGHLERRADHAARGVRDDEIEPAEPLDRLVDDVARPFRVAEMAAHEDGTAALGLDEPRRLRGGLLVPHVADRDVGTFAREGDRRRAADAARSAR